MGQFGMDSILWGSTDSIAFCCGRGGRGAWGCCGSRCVSGCLWLWCGVARGGGFGFCFFGGFLLVLAGSHFRGGFGCWAFILWDSGAFQIFPSFLRCLTLFGNSSGNSYMPCVISNNRASFQLWWKENLVKHWKVSKYYKTDCSFEYSQ